MKNIQYINAGAGSGKTTRLTEILSEKLGNGNIRPSEVILTTFTELAASEFREKSRERLYKDNHAEVAAELDSATIGTVHSVALSFIQKYWYLIGVSPDMKVMSEEDLQVYISESLGNHVDSEALAFLNDYRAYFDINDTLGKADYDYWKEHLLTIIDKANNYSIDIERSKTESCGLVGQIFSSGTALNHELLDKFKKKLNDRIDKYSDNAKKTAQPILDGLNNNVVTYATIVKLYKELTKEKPGIGKKNRNDLIASMADKYTAFIENLHAYQTSSVGDDSPGGMMKKKINLLFDIAKEWKDGFNNFKAKRHIIDYNDMERLFLELLDKPQVKEEIEGTYKLMMVDEFQDSSPIQLKIFKRLSELIAEKDGQSYWVGDPKQSIYGFRGADVELINDITKKFMDEDRDPALNLTYDNLPNSWRTREPLVKLANECFSRAFNGIINRVNVELTAARQEDNRFFCPLSHWNCLASNADTFVLKVADRIQILLDSNTLIQIKNKNEFRRILPGDIAILCRRNDECRSLAKALIKKGIPVTYVNDDILQQTEVQLVFTLLKFMVDASNKHVRADLLRLLEDIPTQDILQQRLDYLTNLKSKVEADEDNTVKEAKTDRWLEEDNVMIKRLLEFKQTVKNLSVSDLLDSIIYGLALPEVVAKWGDVDNRCQNLQTLCVLAKKYDEHCLQMGIGASISGLLTYLSYTEIDNKIDNASEAVKVLTYHKSKGLEWYYVILSSLEKNTLDDDDFIIKNFWGVREMRHPEPNEQYGYYIQFLPRILSTSSTNMPRPIIDFCKELPIYKKLEEKERNELRHLLYVGVTRARDYLTTLSHQSSNIALPILHWIRNTGISDGVLENNAVNLWKYDELKPSYENISDCPVATPTIDTEFTRYQYPENPEIIREPKYLSPSKLPQIEFASDNIKIIGKFKCRIENYDTDETNEAAAGTCIHNIFAVYDPTLSHEENVEKATSIRNGNNMYEVISEPEEVVNSIEHLYAWLEQTYGKAWSVKHEVPFIHPLPGQVVHGEIDLLWILDDKECILVDFKNFPGDKASIMNPENKHYAGNYASQLKAYRDVLINSGLTVRDTLIYYSVMSCVVRFHFT